MYSTPAGVVLISTINSFSINIEIRWIFLDFVKEPIYNIILVFYKTL